jgi:hypothetical protein
VVFVVSMSSVYSPSPRAQAFFASKRQGRGIARERGA